MVARLGVWHNDGRQIGGRRRGCWRRCGGGAGGGCGGGCGGLWWWQVSGCGRRCWGRGGCRCRSGCRWWRWGQVGGHWCRWRWWQISGRWCGRWRGGFGYYKRHHRLGIIIAIAMLPIQLLQRQMRDIRNG